MSQHASLETYIQAYQENPDNFTPEQQQRIVALAKASGRTDVYEPVSGIGNKLSNFAYGAADSVLLGALPNDGVSIGNSGDETARNIGGLLGALVPFAFAGKLGKLGVGAANSISKFVSSKVANVAGPAVATESALAGGKVGKALTKLAKRATEGLKNSGAISRVTPEYKEAIVGNAIAGAWSNLLEDPVDALTTGALTGVGAAYFARRLNAAKIIPQARPEGFVGPINPSPAQTQEYLQGILKDLPGKGAPAGAVNPIAVGGLPGSEAEGILRQMNLFEGAAGLLNRPPAKGLEVLIKQVQAFSDKGKFLRHLDRLYAAGDKRGVEQWLKLREKVGDDYTAFKLLKSY